MIFAYRLVYIQVRRFTTKPSGHMNVARVSGTVYLYGRKKGSVNTWKLCEIDQASGARLEKRKRYKKKKVKKKQEKKKNYSTRGSKMVTHSSTNLAI